MRISFRDDDHQSPRGNERINKHLQHGQLGKKSAVANKFAVGRDAISSGGGIYCS